MDKAFLQVELQGLDETIATDFFEILSENAVINKTPKDVSVLGVILMTIVVPAIGSGIAQSIGEDVWGKIKDVAQKISQMKSKKRKVPSIYQINFKDKNNGRTIFVELDSNASFTIESEVDKIKILLPEIGGKMNKNSFSTLRIEIKDSNWKTGRGKKQDGSTEIVVLQK